MWHRLGENTHLAGLCSDPSECVTTDILDTLTDGQALSVAFWAYELCPRELQGGRESHSRLGLVHRIRVFDMRLACEDITNQATSTTHRRSVAIGDTTEDQAPPVVKGMRADYVIYDEINDFEQQALRRSMDSRG